MVLFSLFWYNNNERSKIMSKEINKYLNLSIVMSILFVILGIILVVSPESSINTIAYMLASFLLVYGTFNFIDSFTINPILLESSSIADAFSLKPLTVVTISSRAVVLTLLSLISL